MKNYTDTGLCIGGPLDGQRRAVLHGAQFIVTEQVGETRMVRPGEFRRVSYARQMFHGDAKTFSVWVLDGMTGDQVMEKLIAGYRGDEALK